MYTYDEHGKEVKGMTDADLYNLVDDVSKLSQTYNVGCVDEFTKHSKKATRGFVITLAGALVGTLYTLIHHGIAQYHLGASAVYRKYADLHEDADNLQDEWRDLDPEVRAERYRFVK